MTFCQRDSPSRFPWSLSNFLCPPSIFSTHLGIKLPFLDSERSVRNLKKSLFSPLVHSFVRQQNGYIIEMNLHKRKLTFVFGLDFGLGFLNWVFRVGQVFWYGYWARISSQIFDRLLSKMRGIYKCRSLAPCDFYVL